MYTHFCTYTYVHTLLYIHLCTYTYVYTLMYIHLCIYTYVHTLMYIHLCTYTYVHTLMYIHLCTYTYVHTLMYIHADHCDDDMTLNEFKTFCRKVWNTPPPGHHNFVTIDLTSGKLDGKYRKNLDCFLSTGYR